MIRKLHCLWIGLCLLPALCWAGSLSRMDAVAIYAADASAALVQPDLTASSTQDTTDASLARQVTDAISGIIASGAAAVNVAAARGQVVLTGMVASQQVEDQLVNTASAVDGVKEVKSELKLSAS